MNELLFISQTIFLSVIALISVRVSYSAALCLSILMSLVSNLFVTKQIILFGWYATSSDTFIVASCIIFNMIQRRYGRPCAAQALRLNFLISGLYALLCWCYLLYTPANSIQECAQTIFGNTPRIIAASLLSFAVSGYLDYSLFGWLQARFFNSLTLINALSIGICQAVDTILFSMLGLYGIVPHLYDIIIISYTLKCFALLICCPLIYLFNYFLPDEIL